MTRAAEPRRERPAVASAPPPAIWDRVEEILAARRPLAVACTGGGSLAVSWLCNHPGASACLMDARIPYHAAALAAELGSGGPHRAVEETARRLARRAWDRAAAWSGRPDAVGLGATAALATDRERRGEEHAFAAVRWPAGYRIVDVRFDKGSAHRLAQEEVLSLLLVDLLARASECPEATVDVPPWAHVESATAPAVPLVEALLEGEGLDAVRFEDRGVQPASRGPRLLVPGSFNPLHCGHLGLAAAAEARSGRRAEFELSVVNVDKPPLTYREVLRRAGQDREGRHLVLTRAATFVDKARRFPGSWFAIGYDTAVRLLSPSYYDDSPAAMGAALAELRHLGCRFLVAGRFCQGAFHRLTDVDVPAAYADLFEEIPESAFRHDVSSTALREGR